MNQNIPSHSDNSSYSTVDDLVGIRSSLLTLFYLGIVIAAAVIPFG